jgi:hypothetical protein
MEFAGTWTDSIHIRQSTGETLSEISTYDEPNFQDAPGAPKIIQKMGAS